MCLYGENRRGYCIKREYLWRRRVIIALLELSIKDGEDDKTVIRTEENKL